TSSPVSRRRDVSRKQVVRMAPDTHSSAPRGDRGGRGGGPAVARLDPADKAQLAEHPVSLRRIGALFTPYRGRLAVVVGLIVATSLVGLATPFITKHLIDDAIPDQDVPLLLALVGGLLAVTVVSRSEEHTSELQSRENLV